MNSYKIQLTGVKDGSNSNSFEIKDKFFETFAQSEISKADIIADTILHKDGNQLTLNIEITGVIKIFHVIFALKKLQYHYPLVLY